MLLLGVDQVMSSGLCVQVCECVCAHTHLRMNVHIHRTVRIDRILVVPSLAS